MRRSSASGRSCATSTAIPPGIRSSPNRPSRTASRPTRSAACATSRCKDGNHIREQLLALSDRDYISTYCILDATLPMQRYVATVQLKRVTDGDRTFWHWQSTFDTPRGREQEFADLVGKGVYEGGFEGLRAFLRRRPGAPARSVRPPAARRWRPRAWSRAASAVRTCCEARSLEAPAPGPGEVRIRHTAIGVNYIDVYVRKGEYRLIEPPAPLGMEAAGVVLDVGDGVAHLLPGDRVAYACAPPGAYVGVRTLPASQVVVLPGRRRRRDRGGADAEGHDRRVPAAPHPPRAVRRDRPRPRGRRRRRLAAVPVGQGARRPGDRHRLAPMPRPARRAPPAATPSSSAATTASPRRCTTPPAAAAPT